MQQLMASLVFGMSVDDAAYRAGMASARSEARKTEQDFDRAGSGMADAIQRSALAVNRAALSMVDSFNSAVAGIKRAGLMMTVGLTIPLGLVGKGATDTASDFQGAMNKVKAAMLTADPRQIEKLRDAALELGPAMGRSSIEAAAAVEALAKNGMDAAAILGGGLKSALTLATVGEAELSEAADLTTDILTQFGKTTRDLPRIVDLVSGALDASKLSFDDYRLAAGNAGGMVAALGYTFDDFNTGLAATAALFDSGAQGGTSYRAFLVSLAGKSEEATKEMHRLKLEFYNADGSAKSLAEIADQLQQKLGGLSDQARNVALNKMFGTDGGQTAIKLMQLGAEGIERAQRAIAGVRADDKVKVLLDGEAAATQRLAASWERLKIAVGEAGLIQIMSAIKNATAAMIDTVAKAPPALFYVVNGIGLLTASIGPVILGLGALLGLIAPVIIGASRLGIAIRVAAGALGLLINPVMTVISGLLLLARAGGAAAVLRAVTGAVVGLLGPLGLASIAVGLLVGRMAELDGVGSDVIDAQDDLAKRQSALAEQTNVLATATGKARREALEHVKAMRIEQVQALATAAALLKKKVAAYKDRRADEKKVLEGGFFPNVLAQLRISRGADLITGRSTKGLGEDMMAAGDALQAELAQSRAIDALFKAPPPVTGGGGKADAGTGATGGGRKGAAASGRDVAADQARYDDELGRLRVDLLQATADLTDGVRSRYKAQMAALDEDRASYERQLANDDSKNALQRAELLKAKDAVIAQQRVIAERDLSIGLAQEEYDLFASRNEAEQEIVRASIDLADSYAAQRAGQLRLLALQKEHEAAEIEKNLATKAFASAEYDAALLAKKTLDERYIRQEPGIRRQTEGPAESYMRSLTLSADGMREAVQAGGVDALRGLNSELVSAGFNVRKLGDAFANMGNRIIATMAEIAIQQKIIRPMAERLFGDAESGGNGGWLGSLLKLGSKAAKGGGGGMTGGNGSIGTGPGSVAGMGIIPINFGGYRASGGPIEPNKWYMTGEKGPEPFFAGRPGTMLSNDALGAIGRRAPAVIQIVGDEGAAFVPRVTSVAGDVSVQTMGRGMRSSARQQGRAARQRLD